MSPSTASPSPTEDSRILGWFFEQNAQPLAVCDLDGRFLRLNQGLIRLLGENRARVGERLDELAVFSSREKLRELKARVMATQRTDQAELEIEVEGDRRLPIRVSLDLAMDESGEPIRLIVFITDISRRKEAERKLAESERRFRQLFDDAPFGYHEIDWEGRILTINQMECEMVGYQREELIGKPIFEFLPEAIRESARESVVKRLRGEIPLEPFERIYRTRDGRELTVAIQERLVKDEDGQVIGLRSMIRDITASKQVEAALIASERRARALFEGIEDVVFVHSLDGRILDANSAASEKLGYSREEFLTLNTSDIDDPMFAVGFENRLREQLRTGRLRCEGRHRTKDGRLIPVDINTTVIQFEGQPAVLAVMRDITERLKLEQTARLFAEAQVRNAEEIAAKNRELMRSEARYRQLTEGCLDGVVVADAQGRITLFNPAAGQIFGFESEEALGMRMAELIDNHSTKLFKTDFQTALINRAPELVNHTIELRGKRKNGETFPLELSLSVADLDGQFHYIGSIRDQTERSKMRSMLIQSEKLASIGLLSAGVAHEINNPLAYVANNLAVLERDLTGVMRMIEAYETADSTLSESAPDALARIQEISDDLDWPYVRQNWRRVIAKTREGVQRVSNIVQSLRGIARTGNQTMELAGIAELTASPLEMIKSRLKKSEIAIEFNSDSLPKLRCVPSQISQVLLNLLMNAIQAIDSAKPTDGGRIRIAARVLDGSHVFEIHDNGCGISPDDQAKLFDPFFTTKPVGEGTGLGLFICHEIITAHNGRIEVESHPGRGSCFRILFGTKDSGMGARG